VIAGKVMEIAVIGRNEDAPVTGVSEPPDQLGISFKEAFGARKGQFSFMTQAVEFIAEKEVLGTKT